MGSTAESSRGSGSGSGSAAATTAVASTSGGGAGRNSRRNREPARSVVDDQGIYNSPCGYCHRRPGSSVSHGLWAHTLTVQDYQDLLDRGWRRSGMFLYKPQMKKTCCPPYTIRLEASRFVANKDQKRVLKRMQRYLDGKLETRGVAGEVRKEDVAFSEGNMKWLNDSQMVSGSEATTSADNAGPSTEHLEGTRAPRPADDTDVSAPPVAKEEEVENRMKGEIEAAVAKCVESGMIPLMMSQLPRVGVKRSPRKVKGKLKYEEGEAEYTSNISFAVAACLKKTKSGAPGPENSQPVVCDLKAQELAEMLAARMPNQCGFTSKASNGYINFVPLPSTFSPMPSAPESPLCQGQTGRKNSGGGKKRPLSLVQSVSEPSSVERRLEIQLKRSSFDAEEFALYKKYQTRVHNDRPEDVREASYRRFLVETPLIFVPAVHDGTTPSFGFGSFHQRYLIDGKLVAVGVIDILPRCLSSKYLFWDPDMAFLALGKYSALQEINWVRETQRTCPTLEYYYLGFYIHSCPKMRYKADYYPSELLCPEHFKWVPYEACVPYLNKQPYVCLSGIVDKLSVPAGSSSPKGSEHDNLLASSPDDEDDYDTATEIEVDFGATEDQERLERSLEMLLEKDLPLDSINLLLNGTFYISFKYLRELKGIPHLQLETIAHTLNRYLQVVGPSLASRMAYALSLHLR